MFIASASYSYKNAGKLAKVAGKVSITYKVCVSQKHPWVNFTLPTCTVLISANITDNTTKRNGIFSLSVTKLFVLLERFRDLQFFLLNVYFRKLENPRIYYMLDKENIVC